jgi:NAD(P)-dependent dehydrogenase (short-subunit alcohol dehydrogenase family)
MSLFDVFRFDGKTALVVGGATGMGAAAVSLLCDAGATVTVMDRAPVTANGVSALKVDLAQRESIDTAIEALTKPFDALFSCAGVADGSPGIERINFVGQRYLIERSIECGLLDRGSAVALISSAAGLGWEAHLDVLTELLAVSDWDQAVAWLHDHGKADYYWTKQAVCAYVASQAFQMLQRGIRINALCPGPTDTPLARANGTRWFALGADYRSDTATEVSTPLEQAYPLVFLCSDAASAINGQTIISDTGMLASGLSNSYPSLNGPARLLCGRTDDASAMIGHV